MKLEDQVAPLALAQEMRALGFPQDTALGWGREGELLPAASEEWIVSRLDTADYDAFTVECAAPTVAEMGEWLGGCKALRSCGEWTASGPNRGENIGPITAGTTEAEARTRLLIALAKAGAIQPRELVAG